MDKMLQVPPEVGVESVVPWGGIQTPRVAVVITHYNYSDHLKDCISSVLQQTYGKVDAIVVDDFSEPQHVERAAEIIASFEEGAVRFVRNSENKGQIHSFYQGLDGTDAEFAVLLDPDDRLHPDFCKEMVGVHLNSRIYCGQATCDQIFARDQVMLTGTSGLRAFSTSEVYRVEQTCEVTFVGPLVKGWHWASTSSLVFRRDAVELLRPKKPLESKRAADVYLAFLIHMIGGTLCYSKPLVVRGCHAENSWLPNHIISKFTSGNGKTDFGPCARREALDIFFSNTGGNVLQEPMMRAALKLHLKPGDWRELLSAHPEAAKFLPTPPKPSQRVRRLKRIIKRAAQMVGLARRA